MVYRGMRHTYQVLASCKYASLIKMLYYFILPWGNQGELVKTPWTHHLLHLFLVEWDALFMGDLVHVGTLWLY